VFDWPKDGKLSIPMAGRIRKAYLLASPGELLACAATAEAVEVRLPARAPDPIASVVVAETEGDVVATGQYPSQAKDGSIVLAATDAEIIGSSARLEGGAEQNVGFWTDGNDYLKWVVRVARPGDFRVSITFACEPSSAGSEYVFTTGGKSLIKVVEATAGWGDYKKADLGVIHLDADAPGTATFMLKPTKKPGLAVMNLRSLVLVPL
jgi:alpha-L-fucosidase